MRHTLPDPLLFHLSEFLEAQIGLHFPRERWGDLERGIVSAAQEFGFPEVGACVRQLLSASLTHRQIEILAGHLTVGETYFFRDRKSFEALEQHVLPALIRSRRDPERRIRIWSAGCCTGEEPYSIAMLLDRLVPDHEQWNITILGTDINPRFLRKAMEGVYGEWSFRDTPGWIRDRYFKRGRQGRFEIHPRIRKMVTFSYLNLVDDVYPSLSNNTNAMDVIFCRNVLMYFSAERAEKVAGNLHHAAADGGWLIVSPTEASNRLFSRFSPVEFPGAIFYRKGSGDIMPAVSEYFPPAFIPEPEIAPPMAPVAPPVLAAPVQERKETANFCAMARQCADQGRLVEAAGWCEKAIAEDKLNPQSHYLLATIRQELNQPGAAEQSLKHALYLDPDFALAHFALGNLRLKQGMGREAERHFRNALALLQKHSQDEPLAESEGLTAGRLIEIILSILSSQPHAVAVL